MRSRVTIGLWVAAFATSFVVRVASAEDRRPTPVMGVQGAPWLEREGREKEQRPDDIILSMGLRDGQVVADLGCGTGWFARRLARAVAPSGKVYAIDIQPEMLELMKGYLAREEVTNVVPVLGVVDDPRVPAGALDWVLMVDVYHELQEPKAMLARVRESLKPQGKVALIEYRAEGDSAAHIRPEHRMSVEQILREWTPAGFRMTARHEDLPTQHFLVFEKE